MRFSKQVIVVRQYTPGQNDVLFLIERAQQPLAERSHPRRVTSDMRCVLVTGARNMELPFAKQYWWAMPRTTLLLAVQQHFFSLFLSELTPSIHIPSCSVRSPAFRRKRFVIPILGRKQVARLWRHSA